MDAGSHPRAAARHCRRFAAAALLGLPVFAVAAEAPAFFAVGDLPYSASELVGISVLLDEATVREPPFLLHVGDIKGGGQTCTDERMEAIADLFRRQSKPVLYTPGDNDWTDCHRRSAGAMDPLERLRVLRRTFFADPAVLRNAGLQPIVPDPAFPENRWLRLDDLVLALVHVVGSENNAGATGPDAVAELAARNAANRALLDQVVARGGDVAGMIIIFHANPLFERRRSSKGFAPILADIEQVLARYAGPVLVIHGDTHTYRFDQPWPDRPGGERLWRLEVPGSPTVAGTWVRFDAHAKRPFAVELYPPQPVIPDLD